MNKEELIELRKRLEQEKRDKSKYIKVAPWGIELNTKYTIDQIRSECNEKGICDNIENLFEKLIYYYNDKEGRYDSITICLVYELFYKECDLEWESDLIDGAESACDYAKISVSNFYREKENDPDIYDKADEFSEEIYEQYREGFIISLSEFKKELHLRGFDITTIPSFDELDENIKDGDSIVSRLTIEFPSIIKKLKK